MFEVQQHEGGLGDRADPPGADIQNRCASRSTLPPGTHAVSCVRPVLVIHDRSTTVLPLPGGADTSTTRAGPAEPLV